VIRACCRLSPLLDIPLNQAAKNVVPVTITAAEQLERLRERPLPVGLGAPASIAGSTRRRRSPFAASSGRATTEHRF
jgi:hypothetical protein